MLSPDTGVTLVDALRPPDGYQLDIAVGTTFTLDLVALLAIPTAFSFAPSAGEHTDKAELPPLGRLEALRTYSGRITVFSDAAHISLPDTSAGSILGFLDDAVVPVRAPRGGYFHPKIWIVRFRTHGNSLLHRVLIPSRNLTFDRSRDTLALLDEVPPEERSDTATTLPTLTQILSDLPHLAVGSVPEERRSQLDDLSRTVATARFALPTGFDAMQLHTLGFTDAAPAIPLPANATRSLIISPFLGATLPDLLSPKTNQLTLVSRPAALDRAFSEQPPHKKPTAYVLNPDLIDDVDDQEPTVDTDTDSAAGAVPPDENDTGGLHAKLFVYDLPSSRTSMFTGSANATENAFRRNSEVLLQLDGPTRKVGVAEFLRPQTQDRRGGLQDGAPTNLMSILVEHQWSEYEADEDSEAEQKIAALRTELSAIPIRADVTEVTATGSSETTIGRFEVSYTATEPWQVPTGLAVEVRPITQSEWQPVKGDPLAVAGPLSVHELTRFLGVRVRMGKTTETFVLAAEMHDAPENRSDLLLSHFIESPERLINYLMILLRDLPVDRFGSELTGTFERYAGSGSDLRTAPLLEYMLRALIAAPDRLREVDRLMSLVTETSDLADADLVDLWASVSKLMGSKR